MSIASASLPAKPLESAASDADSTAEAASRAGDGRVVVIDILRGLAILWVITFHAWTDMGHYVGGRSTVYWHVSDRVLDGQFGAAIVAVGELILSIGYFGVPIFMMLSGLSLTMMAYNRGEPKVLTGYLARFRKIVPVYWAGILLILATIAVLALLQAALDGGTFIDQWSQVRIAGTVHTNIEWRDIAWTMSVGGWLARDKYFTLPVSALWFVQLLLLYYLIFPFALRLMKRVGATYFALGSIVLTLAIRAAYLPWADDVLGIKRSSALFTQLPLFRGSEFFLGMAVGYLFVQHREKVREWFKSPVDIAGIVAAGIALIVLGMILKEQDRPELVFSEVIIQLGLLALMLPLLFKAPGRLEVSAPVRAITFVGVLSFTTLIVNEQMRYIGAFLRWEGVTGPPWWFFLWVVYVPVSVLVAYPFARLFGLLPRQRVAAQSPQARAAHVKQGGRAARRRRQRHTAQAAARR